MPKLTGINLLATLSAPLDILPIPVANESKCLVASCLFKPFKLASVLIVDISVLLACALALASEVLFAAILLSSATYSLLRDEMLISKAFTCSLSAPYSPSASFLSLFKSASDISTAFWASASFNWFPSSWVINVFCSSNIAVSASSFALSFSTCAPR